MSKNANAKELWTPTKPKRKWRSTYVDPHHVADRMNDYEDDDVKDIQLRVVGDLVLITGYTVVDDE